MWFGCQIYVINSINDILEKVKLKKQFGWLNLLALIGGEMGTISYRHPYLEQFFGKSIVDGDGESATYQSLAFEG